MSLNQKPLSSALQCTANFDEILIASFPRLSMPTYRDQDTTAELLETYVALIIPYPITRLTLP